ncbi:MAG: hypothetical protein IT426_10945 [Pirellulales bacterium]|nr:hypothetical protein [Pirellulales bacterium]
MNAELPPAVRQGTSWKPTAVLALATFALTILAAQLWEHMRAPSVAAINESAMAIVEQRPPVFSQDNAASSGRNSLNRTQVCAKTVQRIKEQVTAPEQLRQAWRELRRATGKNSISTPAAAELEKLRRSLMVEVEESPMGGKCLRLASSWPNSQDAAILLKCLGQQYAERYRAAWMTGCERECTAARTVSDRAKRDYEDAVAVLDLFQAYLDCQEAAEDASLNRQVHPPLSTLHSPHTKENSAELPRDESKIENTEWLKLQNDLAAMREKEAKLLEKRTALHPEVVYLKEQIYECETLLAITVRWLSTENALHPTEEIGPSTPLQTPREGRPEEGTVAQIQREQQDAEDAEFLAQLEEQAVTAALAHREAVARERTSLAQRNLAPEIGVRVWMPPKVAAKTPSPSPLGWLAGAMIGLGVGLICTGKSIEPPIGSVEELQRLTATPIIGVVPSYNPAVDPRSVKRRKRIFRWGLFISGLMMFAVCTWAIIQH